MTTRRSSNRACCLPRHRRCRCRLEYSCKYWYFYRFRQYRYLCHEAVRTRRLPSDSGHIRPKRQPARLLLPRMPCESQRPASLPAPDHHSRLSRRQHLPRGITADRRIPSLRALSRIILPTKILFVFLQIELLNRKKAYFMQIIDRPTDRKSKK